MASFFLKLKESFRNAFRGLVKVYGSELTFRIQFWWGIIVISQIFYWPLGEIKRLVLLLLILLTLLAEILNTTFEKLFDIIEKKHNERFWRIISGKFKNYQEMEKELFIYWFLLQTKVLKEKIKKVKKWPL